MRLIYSVNAEMFGFCLHFSVIIQKQCRPEWSRKYCNISLDRYSNSLYKCSHQQIILTHIIESWFWNKMNTHKCRQTFSDIHTRWQQKCSVPSQQFVPHTVLCCTFRQDICLFHFYILACFCRPDSICFPYVFFIYCKNVSGFFVILFIAIIQFEWVTYKRRYSSQKKYYIKSQKTS